jgi:hypothetical protein
MKEKHTPGPWGQENAMSSDHEAIRYITGPDCEDVATVHQKKLYGTNEYMSQETALANARLIAAAPELLEAAIMLLERLEVYHNCGRIHEDMVIDDARRAIAKVTGVEQWKQMKRKLK